MPRTYSFDHFTAMKPDPSKRAQPGRPPRFSPPRDTRPGELHYGKAHAQTEELYHAREMEAQLEELAGMPPKEEAKPLPEPTAERFERGMPIGALPHTEELTPMATLRDALDEVSRRTRGLATATRELGGATARLAKVPLEVARLAARRLELALGRR